MVLKEIIEITNHFTNLGYSLNEIEKFINMYNGWLNYNQTNLENIFLNVDSDVEKKNKEKINQLLSNKK